MVKAVITSVIAIDAMDLLTKNMHVNEPAG
jgi:hypothetical protein